jgi:hypothetical protein
MLGLRRSGEVRRIDGRTAQSDDAAWSCPKHQHDDVGRDCADRTKHAMRRGSGAAVLWGKRGGCCCCIHGQGAERHGAFGDAAPEGPSWDMAPWLELRCAGEERHLAVAVGKKGSLAGRGGLAMARIEKEEGDVLLFGAGKGNCRASAAMEESRAQGAWTPWIQGGASAPRKEQGRQLAARHGGGAGHGNLGLDRRRKRAQEGCWAAMELKVSAPTSRHGGAEDELKALLAWAFMAAVLGHGREMAGRCSTAARARTREVPCAEGAEGPTTKGERGTVGLLLEEEEEGQGAPCHSWPKGGAGLGAMGGRVSSSRGGSSPAPRAGKGGAMGAARQRDSLRHEQERRGLCVWERRKKAVAAGKKWRVGVKNCQFAREGGAIYRRGTRVRVLNGPNGLGWAGPNTLSGCAKHFPE